MKNFLTTASMALILVTAAAGSAYCGNANREISRPLSGVRLSVAKASIMVLAQAAPQSHPGSNQNSGRQTLPSGGLLAAEIGAPDSQGGAGNLTTDGQDGIGTPPLGTPGTGDPVPGCKNGMAEGNKHCVNTPSQ
jgi:hypothetical protein